MSASNACHRWGASTWTCFILSCRTHSKEYLLVGMSGDPRPRKGLDVIYKAREIIGQARRSGALYELLEARHCARQDA